MKCSLLTLSTFIDGALPPDRGAEVDAHLVGCPRCTAGAASLREEKGRIAQLARVRVQPESAQNLLEQVGITGAVPEQLHRERPSIRNAPDGRPWLSGSAGAALPWAPQRPTAAPPRRDRTQFTEEQIVPTVRPDVQPDLPFDAASPPPVSTTSVETKVVPEKPGPDMPAPPPWREPGDQRVVPLEPWEAAVPGYSDTSSATHAWAPPIDPARGDRGTVPQQCAPEFDVSAFEEPPAVPPPMSGPPHRLQAPGGPRALFDRARDAVAVRLALSRRDEGAEVAVGVVHQAAPPRRLPPPIAGFEDPEMAVTQLPTPARGAAEAAPRPAALPAHTAAVPSGIRPGAVADVDDRPMELTGFTGAPTPTPSRASSVRALRQRAETDDPDNSTDDGSWNAFGAAAFRGETAPAAEAAPARAPGSPLGRHSRAVQRRSDGIGVRLSALMTSALSAVRGSGAHAAASRPSGDGVVHGGGSAAARRDGFTFDRRIALAIGGVVAIFLVALLIGHLGSRTPAVSRVTASTAPSAAPHSAAGSSARAATAAPAPAGRPTTTAPLPATQTFGKGGSGFQVLRMRYGTFSGSQRIVVDLAGATGEPLTTIGFSGTTAMLVTFNGTIPAGSLAAPPAGGVVTSITRVPSSAGTTTYLLTLSRAARPVAFYLAGPLRFVLDLH